MPPGLTMRPAPRTSTPVIGARDFLLHRGGAVDETTRETQAHFQLAVSIWHMLEHKLGTPDIPLSAEFDKLYACHAHSCQEVCLGAPESLRTSHSCLSPARELMLSTAVGRDCGSSGCQSSGWTIPARLGAVWVTAWPYTAGGTRVVCFKRS